ncbi:threonine-phosphate decarboxylase CobD [Pararobbsia alpina]|uniref:threonine-phosphate decarboxylase n=1 Tax=Pararobbsia alpina TaxID=621374 RepID=A0A6S7B831_9BURK|nr:threonine-phosphate decarboxylase CobD [Pararobbsia alpina]CAB3790489.1 Histidinol-phosphate aminotransferase [Pararobbsia alpina]
MNGHSHTDALPPHVAHGGNLDEAIQRHGIAREHWLDLSTGINPNGYPVPPIDPQAWLRLPDDHDDLEAVAAAHYGCENALALAGTQAAIRMLPLLLARGTVGISTLTYGEYAPAFEHAGFPVERFVSGPLADATVCKSLAQSEATHLMAGQRLPGHWRYLVIVNPNNPTAEVFDPATLLDWHSQLAARGGCLIVDEAFADATPASSIAFASGRAGLVVLRSVGKFFGLAGARVGFLLAQSTLIDAARRLSGPWTVTGPARAVVRAALLDTAWQQATRAQLPLAAERLARLLEAHDLCVFRTALFAWVPHPHAAELHEALAKTGIWVRYFDRIPSLRFGLPRDETGWKALNEGLRRPIR